MSDVLDEFREWKARWPDRLSTHYIGCYVHHHECMIHRLAAEVERLRNGAAAVRQTVTYHDAAPAARASLPTADHAVCRGRESGCGTGNTPTLAAGARAANRDGGSGDRHPPHSSPASAVTDDRPAPTAATLTRQERETLRAVRDIYESHDDDECARIAATLSRILARLGGGA